MSSYTKICLHALLCRKEMRNKIHVNRDQYRCSGKAVNDTREMTQYHTNQCIIYKLILSVSDRSVEKHPKTQWAGVTQWTKIWKYLMELDYIIQVSSKTSNIYN